MDVPENEAAPAAGLNLAKGFPTATRAQWRELVAGVLRKSGAAAAETAAEPESLLATRTYDGFAIEPLYTLDQQPHETGYPGVAPFTRGAHPQGAVGTGWDVRQRHADPDPPTARRQVLADLENGVGSLWIAVGASGVPADALGEVLADVHLDLAPVVLDAGADYAAAAEALLRAHADAGVPAARTEGNLGVDPLTEAARTGRPSRVEDAAAFAASHAARYPRLRLMVADATPVHEAGGSDGQELGAAMAAGTAYLRALTGAGLELADAARRIEFRFAASADQFAVIAKLRAARAMWDRVLHVCGLAARHRGMRQHAVTSEAMMTRRDPHVNMLRTTLACFGAGVGGADAVTVRPFDAALGLPDDFARRIARNTQSLLIEEAHLARVIDPAGGSFYAERLTAELYAAGWAFFQELEAAGGMAAALSGGLLAERVDQVWRRRRDNLAHRRDPLTGVSEFPDLDEVPLVRAPAPGPDPQARHGALPRRRYAAEFEDLRDRSDRRLGDTGQRPHVFLATLGPVAAHTARASFAANLLAAGGIAADNPGPLADADAAVEAFTASSARVAVICSSDRIYAEHAAATARALKGAGARRVLLAGRPLDAYRDAGVDAFAHTGCDAVALLADLADILLTDSPITESADTGAQGVAR